MAEEVGQVGAYRVLTVAIAAGDPETAGPRPTGSRDRPPRASSPRSTHRPSPLTTDSTPHDGGVMTQPQDALLAGRGRRARSTAARRRRAAVTGARRTNVTLGTAWRLVLAARRAHG